MIYWLFFLSLQLCYTDILFTEQEVSKFCRVSGDFYPVVSCFPHS